MDKYNWIIFQLENPKRIKIRKFIIRVVAKALRKLLIYSYSSTPIEVHIDAYKHIG